MRQDVTPLRFSNRGLVAHTAVQFLDQSIQGLCYICGRGSCGTVWVKILNKIKKLPPQHAGCCVLFAPLKCLSELSYTFFRFRCPGCCLLLVSLKLLSQLSDTGSASVALRSISESLDSSSEHRLVAAAHDALCRSLLCTTALFVCCNCRLANHNRTASSFESAGGFCGAEERAMVYGGISSLSLRAWRVIIGSIRPELTTSVKGGQA